MGGEKTVALCLLFFSISYIALFLIRLLFGLSDALRTTWRNVQSRLLMWVFAIT